MQQRLLIFIGAVVVLLEGCTMNRPMPVASENKPVAIVEQPGKIYLQSNDALSPVEQVRVTAVGYGAPPKKYYPENQRKLMAMRAAKLDAYRTLAERIQGLRVTGGSTVGELVLEQEGFQTMLDGFVLGAKVLSVQANEDGNYEAVVETVVDQDFLNRVMALRQERAKKEADRPALIVEKVAEKAADSTPKKLERGQYSVGSQPNFYYSDAPQ